MESALADIGSLLIRITVGLLFLTGAWECGKEAGARKFTEGETSLVFKSNVKFFAMAGILIMGGGGLSILLGVFPRLGALGLSIFLVPAAMIHLSKRGQAGAFKDKVLASATGDLGDTARKALDELHLSAVIGHYTSALKNLSLIGPTLYLVLAGARTPMLIGFGPDWQLDGLLTRL